MSFRRSSRAWLMAVLLVPVFGYEIHHTTAYLAGKPYETVADWLTGLALCIVMVCAAYEIRHRSPNLVNYETAVLGGSVAMFAAIGASLIFAYRFFVDGVTLVVLVKVAFIAFGMFVLALIVANDLEEEHVAIERERKAYRRRALEGIPEVDTKTVSSSSDHTERSGNSLSALENGLYGVRIGTKVP